MFGLAMSRSPLRKEELQAPRPSLSPVLLIIRGVSSYSVEKGISRVCSLWPKATKKLLNNRQRARFEHKSYFDPHKGVFMGSNPRKPDLTQCLMSARAFHEKAGRCQGFVFGPCKFISMFSFARIVGKTWPARTAVKAERSEFIWSLDGGRSRPYRVVPGEGKHRYPLVSNIRYRVFLSPPFHPHSGVSGIALGASWVFSIQPALPPVRRPSTASGDEVSDQALDAVAGTRRRKLDLLQNWLLCGHRLRSRTNLSQWYIYVSAYPEPM